MTLSLILNTQGLLEEAIYQDNKDPLVPTT